MGKPLTSHILQFAAIVSVASASLTHAQYKVINTVKVGGDGGYDYVTADSTSRRLYIARSGAAGALHVYNLDTLAETGTVSTGSAHGAVVDDANHHGFATSKPVTMFDSQSLAVIKTIDTKSNPDGFLLDAAAHTVYILSHSAPQLTAIDTATGNITGTLDIAGAVEQSVLDGRGNLYIDLEDKDSIAVVDTRTLKLERTIDISSKGGGCSGLAIDPKNGVLFAACNDKKNMIIIDAPSGKIITTLPIGTGCDGAAFNPATMEAFTTQGDGTLTVIKENSPTTFTVEQTVSTPPRARTITLDTSTGHIFTVTAQFGAAPPAAPGQRSRPPMIPGTFEIVKIGK